MARASCSGHERLEILACDRFQHRIGVGFEEFPPSGRFHLALPLEMAWTKSQGIFAEYLETSTTDTVRVKPIQDLRGFLRDIDTSVEREPDRV